MLEILKVHQTHQGAKIMTGVYVIRVVEVEVVGVVVVEVVVIEVEDVGVPVQAVASVMRGSLCARWAQYRKVTTHRCRFRPRSSSLSEAA